MDGRRGGHAIDCHFVNFINSGIVLFVHLFGLEVKFDGLGQTSAFMVENMSGEGVFTPFSFSACFFFFGGGAVFILSHIFNIQFL